MEDRGRQVLKGGARTHTKMPSIWSGGVMGMASCRRPPLRRNFISEAGKHVLFWWLELVMLVYQSSTSEEGQLPSHLSTQ